MTIDSIINPKHTTPEAIAALREKFDTAVPYRHIVIEDFFNDDIANRLYNNFPKIDTLNVKRKSFNEDKSEDYHFDRWDPVFTEVREVIKSDEWYKIMTALTGVDGLKTTMDALGSGVHQGKNGSYVDVHVDVNMNPQANLWRRINLLVYLNKNWKPEYGGDLEVWDKDMSKLYNKLSPTFNRALIFYTDDNSPHGYNKINVPEGESRKSFYTYYYTELSKDFKYRDSKFIPRPDDSKARKLATTAKETLKIKGKQFLKALGIRSLDFQDKNK